MQEDVWDVLWYVGNPTPMSKAFRVAHIDIFTGIVSVFKVLYVAFFGVMYCVGAEITCR